MVIAVSAHEASNRHSFQAAAAAEAEELFPSELMNAKGAVHHQIQPIRTRRHKDDATAAPRPDDASNGDWQSSQQRLHHCSSTSNGTAAAAASGGVDMGNRALHRKKAPNNSSSRSLPHNVDMLAASTTRGALQRRWSSAKGRLESDGYYANVNGECCRHSLGAALVVTRQSPTAGAAYATIPAMQRGTSVGGTSASSRYDDTSNEDLEIFEWSNPNLFLDDVYDNSSDELQHGRVLQAATTRSMPAQRRSMIQAVTEHGEAFYRAASSSVESGRNVFLLGLRNGHIPYFVPNRLRNDQEVVLYAFCVVRNRERFTQGIEDLLDKYDLDFDSTRGDGDFWSQFKVLKKEKQFRLNRNIPLKEFDKEALHCASQHGYESVIFYILTKYSLLGNDNGDNNTAVHDLVYSTLSSDSKNGDRPLHRAARNGHYEACRALVDMGGRVNRNKVRKTPLELAVKAKKKSRKKKQNETLTAKQKEYEQVIHLLRSFDDMIATGLMGKNAHDEAMSDEGVVTKVSWNVCPLNQWTRFFGACHSVLVVTVSAESGDDDGQYFIQNVNAQDNVRVHFWRERSYLEKSFKTIATVDRSDVKANLKIADLIHEAKRTKVYDLGKHNCHHVACDVFNFCLKEGSDKKVESVPNNFLASLGKRVGGRGSTVWNSNGIDVQSDPAMFCTPVVDEVSKLPIGHYSPPDVNHEQALVAAKLSFQIYDDSGSIDDTAWNPSMDGIKVMHFVRENEANVVRWGIAKLQNVIYVVFKGTENLSDSIVDAMAFPVNGPRIENGKYLGVHGGAWSALHLHNGMTTFQINDVLAHLKEVNPGAEVVLCGHSLGGAYAILCGLELLQMNAIPIHSVIAFGAPQVIKPDLNSVLWNRLNAISKVYINGYDMVPRLPSCIDEWKDTLLNVGAVETRKRTGFFSVRLDRFADSVGLWQTTDQMQGYRHVGKLVFTSSFRNDETNSTAATASAGTATTSNDDNDDMKWCKCFVVDAQTQQQQSGRSHGDGDGWNILKTPPTQPGLFISSHHHEYPQVLETLVRQEREGLNARFASAAAASSTMSGGGSTSGTQARRRSSLRPNVL